MLSLLTLLSFYLYCNNMCKCKSLCVCVAFKAAVTFAIGLVLFHVFVLVKETTVIVR